MFLAYRLGSTRLDLLCLSNERKKIRVVDDDVSGGCKWVVSEPGSFVCGREITTALFVILFLQLRAEVPLWFGRLPRAISRQ